MRTVFLVVLISLQTLSGPQPDVQSVVSAVSRNAQEFRDKLPDLVCTEKITSTTLESGKVQKQKIVESLFSVLKSREYREVFAVDGKAVKKTSNLPDLPVDIGGTFSFHVLLTFLPQYLKDYDFKFEGNADPAGTWILLFETKPDQKSLKWDLDGSRIAKDSGKAWIDIGSSEVVRIERSLLNLPRKYQEWKVAVDQAPTLIGGKQLWIPKTFRTDITERDSQKTASFVAEYTNCRKFGADVSVTPATP